ncbi:MAG: HAD-IA family hydrolase [Candidatus Moranbacteria bacterium]|nr:HAD-IA family hydrolase [Candidatus Moranbacteria bacterium]
MNKKTIIFDFDGTIADTLDVVVNIYNKLAPKYFCKTLKREDVEILRNKKSQEFMKDYGISKFKLPFLVLHIRKYLNGEMKNVKPIDGIIETLKELKNLGYNLGIMTSNSKKNVENFLKINNLDDIFDFVYSSKNLFGKDKVIKKIINKYFFEKDLIIYVGDEVRDVEMSKKLGISVLAVSWGFNSREMLENAGADVIVDNSRELLECLQKF